jgi:hypothetical protein
MHGRTMWMAIANNQDEFLEFMKHYVLQTGDQSYGLVESSTHYTSIARMEQFSRVLATHFMSCMDAVWFECGFESMGYATTSRYKSSKPLDYTALVRDAVLHAIFCYRRSPLESGYDVSYWRPTIAPCEPKK